MPSHASVTTSEDAILDPQRCQFSFADGRRCRMQSAQPALCPAHASAHAITQSEQYRQKFATSLAPLSGEFRTATEINCALGKVFLAVAQNRIPRRDAVALGYLAQLMLQTLPAVKAEYIAVDGYDAWQQALDDALQEDPEEGDTEPTAEAAADESQPEAADACEEPAESDNNRAVAVARVFSESGPPDSEGPEAFAVDLGTPISALAPAEGLSASQGATERSPARRRWDEESNSPEPGQGRHKADRSGGDIGRDTSAVTQTLQSRLTGLGCTCSPREKEPSVTEALAPEEPPSESNPTEAADQAETQPRPRVVYIDPYGNATVVTNVQLTPLR